MTQLHKHDEFTIKFTMLGIYKVTPNQVLQGTIYYVKA